MRRIFVAAIIAICALAPSAGSADHIADYSPDNISQKQDLLHASANWSFDEPAGSDTHIGVDVQDEVVNARGQTYKRFDACLTVTQLSVGDPANPNDDVFRSFVGCQPLRQSQFRLEPKFAHATVDADVPVRECTSRLDPPGRTCEEGPSFHVKLSWTATDELTSHQGRGEREGCHIREGLAFRHHVVDGSITQGSTEYTRSDAGWGQILKRIVTWRVEPGATGSCFEP